MTVGPSDDSSSRTARPRTVYLETLGCEKNSVDSEGALGLLLQEGFQLVFDPADAGLIVLNTCGFLDSAREESLDRLRELASNKGPAKLVAMGCLVQGGTHDLQREVDGIDEVLGVGQYHRLSEVASGGHAGPLGSPEDAPYAGYGSRVLLTPSHVAHIKLAEGCNQKCSFCKIPALRGQQRSRAVPEILEEAHGLVAQGVRELILIAQNSSAYGIDLPQKPRLGDLCRSLATIPQLDWIRVMYAYPPMFTNALAEDVYSTDKVCSYLDIPVQHASPRILEAMDRGYDIERFRRQIDFLRKMRPDLMLRSTALLGFPGETEDDLTCLMDFLAEIEFDHLGTFVYSHEEKTSAYGLEDDIEPEEKEDRRARVEALQWEIGLETKNRWLGREVEVIIDEVYLNPEEALLESVAVESGEDRRSEWSASVAVGRTEGFCYEVDGGVWLEGEGLQPGQIVKAKLAGCGPYDFLGERLQELPPRGKAIGDQK